MANEIGVIGMGAMGGNMTLLLASKGYTVSAYNREEGGTANRLSAAKKQAKEQGLYDKILFTDSVRDLVSSLKVPRKILIVISHGKNVDEICGQLSQYLNVGDLLVDCGNEWYQETERRICDFEKKGVLYLGMGVSGGYQSARQGPSMSPGGPKQAFDVLEPVLKKIAPYANVNGTQKPCYTYVGPRGSGHFVKMVHNGIEQGMMSSVSEAYGIMRDLLHFTPPQIADEFEKWCGTKELKNNFLVQISVDICRRPEENHKSGYLIDYILDNVIQDADSTEGTGTWTVRDDAARHSPCPTIVAAHYFRLTSALLHDRQEASKLGDFFDVKPVPAYPGLDEDLRMAVYVSHLCSFIEGFNLMARASKDENWELHLTDIVDIYRAGCIIQSDYILDLLQKVYSESREKPLHNLFLSKTIAQELKRGMQSLRSIVSFAALSSHPIPALSATLSHILANYSTKLSTNMMQAQLDYFGLHMYSRTDEKVKREEELEHQKHHTEWKSPQAL